MSVNDDTLGAFLVGVVLGAFFLGVACLQSFTYFTTYVKDPWYIKSVFICLICNIAHQIGITQKMYVNTVTNYGNIAILADIGWGLTAHVYLTAFTAITVQMFYFYRIYLLLDKKHWWLPAVLTLACLAQFIMAFMYSIKITTLTSSQLVTLTGLISGVNGVSAGLDFVISAIMVYIFSNKRTGFRKTDTLLIKLIAYVVSSGFLTSVCALGTFIAFKVSPATFIAYPFNFLISRMYIVALLVTLNSRMGLRTSGKETTDDFAMSISHVQFKRAQNSTTGTINDSRPAPVLVSVERHDDGYHSPVKQVKSSANDSYVDYS
ncbi:hypothetical protein K435DRAFT_108369 [Dendrothele bispora CBS 962.96]|uniref:DUF6534 domain-containing protein n=1 Tax=Dendrothele bispora (strain CBS 962.96) TaxID=1314807 RepID=A0A4S8M2H3_DENBC|nr:hypothetical protein K435DRAFT_108369 [Dendrothele bispora CBS 962.96]